MKHSEKPTSRNRSSTPDSAIHCVDAPAAGLLTSTYISAAFSLPRRRQEASRENRGQSTNNTKRGKSSQFLRAPRSYCRTTPTNQASLQRSAGQGFRLARRLSDAAVGPWPEIEGN